MKNPVQTAIDELRNVFPPHPLNTEGVFAEWGGSYTDGKAFKAEAQGKGWDELSTRFLAFHHDALLFLGPEAVIDVIPACLAAVLRQDRGLGMLPRFLIGVLTRSDDTRRFDARFGRLMPAQRQAITQALEVWQSVSIEDEDRQRSITQALESYWRKLEDGR